MVTDLKTTLTMIAAALVLLAPVAPASAKSLSRMIAESGLTPEDFTILSETARQLYDRASPRQGATASWTNPESGSRGDVRLDRFSDGCAELTHRVYPKGGDESRALRTKRCRDAEGNWLLAP